MEMEITQSPTGPDAPQQQVPATETSEQPQPPTEQVNPQAPDTEAPEPPQQNPGAAPDEAVSKFVQDAGFDPIELSKQIATAGDIAPEAKTALGEKLEKAGLPASMVDEYITGQKAVMERAVQDIMSVAGGSDGYAEMCQWAKASLSDAEIAAFNKVMDTADVDTAKLMVGNMYARYRTSTPAKGRTVRGTSGAGGSGSDIFKSWEQQKEAQRDPRYRTDPAFRAEVEAKIGRTLASGGYKAVTR